MNGVYTRFWSIAHDFASLTVKGLLLRSTGTYSFNPDHDYVADLFSNGAVELSVASYLRGDFTTPSLTLDDSANRYVGSCDPCAFGDLEIGQTVKALVLYSEVTNDADSNLIAYIDGNITVTVAAPVAVGTTGAITGITRNNPAVVTSAVHGLSNGDKVYIASVLGMTQINGVSALVANKTTNTFELAGVNSTAYSNYSSAGSWSLVRRVYTEPLLEAIPDGTLFSRSGGGTGYVVGTPLRNDRYIDLRNLSVLMSAGDTAQDVPTNLGWPIALGGGPFTVNIPAAGLFELRGK